MDGEPHKGDLNLSEVNCGDRDAHVAETRQICKASYASSCTLRGKMESMEIER